MKSDGVRLVAFLLAAAAIVVAGACEREEKAPTLTTTPGASPAPSPTPVSAPLVPTSTSLPAALPPVPSGSLIYLVSGWDFEVYRVNVDGSDLMNLTRNPAADEPGAWSPDGQQIAFTSHREGNGDIFVMDANGSQVRNVTKTPELGEGVLSWSPDGQHLLFNVGANESGAEFWVMRPDGSDRRQLVPFCRDCFAINWSPDGKWLAGQLSTEEGRGLYVINVDSGARDKITDVARAVVYWSPDGEHIAFVRDFGSAGAQISIVRPDGSDLHAVYQAPYIGRISWSPDSSHFAFGVLSELNAIAMDGSDLRKIASGKDIWEPQWSGDGQYIAFSSGHEGNKEIYVVGAYGGNLRNVSNSPWEDVRPLWSPDSRRLTFRSNRDSPEGLYWMWPDGSQQTRMTTGPVEPRPGGALPYVYPGLLTQCPNAPEQPLAIDCPSPERITAAIAALEPEGIRLGRSPAVSLDGRKVAFLGQKGDVTFLYVLDVGSGMAQRLTEADAIAPAAIQWSPDGEYVYYTKGGYCIEGCAAGFLYRIRADGTEEEKLTDLRVSALLGFVP